MVDQAEFLKELAETLEVEYEISADTKISEVDWDSLATLSVIALANEKYGILLSGEDIIKCKSYGAIVDLIKSNS